MEKKFKTPGTRNFDALISMLSADDILNVREMICVRGGDDPTTPILVPPTPPKTEN